MLDGLVALSTSYPDHRFEALMDFNAVWKATQIPCTMPPLDQPVLGRFVGANAYKLAPSKSCAQLSLVTDIVEFVYLPRIRCLDCPGELHKPGPGESVSDFEHLLRSRSH